MPKLPLKKTERLAEREALGRTLGEEKAKARWAKTKSGIKAKLFELFERHIRDIPEWVAIVGVTIIVKGVIASSVDLTQQVQNLASLVASGKPLEWSMRMLLGGLGRLSEYQALTKSIQEYAKSAPLKYAEHTEWWEWFIAFTLAYIIVKNAGEIIMAMGDMTKGIGGMVSMLMAGIG